MTRSVSFHGKRQIGATAGFVLLATIHTSAQGLPSQQQTTAPARQEEIDFRTQGIDLKTQERLLDFLNRAKFPEPIARALGVEKQVATQILAHRRRFGPFGYRRLEEIRPFWRLPQRLRDRIIALFGPAVFGEWHTLPYDLQRPNGTTFSAAHSAMLHTGKVLFFPEFDSTETLLWDPANETTPVFSFPDNQPGNFLFCSGHSFLSDGRLLAVGGGGNFVSNAKNTAWKFDPDAGTNGVWQQTSQNMAFQRWYPTAVTLGYPYVLVAGGVFGSSVQVTKLEIYNEANDTFAQVNGPPASPTAADHEFPETYPGLHLLPSGKVLYTHTGFGHGFLPTESHMTASYLELTGPTTGSWTTMTSAMTYPDRTEGMSVQILGPEPKGKGKERASRVIVFGGGNPEDEARPRAEAIDTTSLSPSTPWSLLADYMGAPRFHASAVLLPDGKVFVFGGAEHGDNGSGGYKQVDLFHPESDTFTPADTLQYARGYHTVTVLLPSAKVMVSGGTVGANETKMEIFSPPYLFKGPRPTISSAPTTVAYGADFVIGTSDFPKIDKVVLVRPMAYTHHTDSEQRVIELEFQRGPKKVTATAPAGITFLGGARPLAPSGYYMLFLVNKDGVPSEARFIRLH